MIGELYLPRDTTTAALGGERVAAVLTDLLKKRGLEGNLVRTGSRGMFWREPLLEADTDQGRVAFGPVTEADVKSILDALEKDTQTHPLYLGPVADIEWLRSQRRVTFARAGSGDPLCLETYLSQRGFAGLHRALQMTPAAIVAEIIDSGLRGRGGAAFPAGIKWRTVLECEAPRKYIVCNADEGDSGTFADRLLMEADPFQLIEGMTIAALAVGADKGYIYLRSEYPLAREVLSEALRIAREQGFLGDDLCGSGRVFDIELRIGAGAYICGEETSLLDSLEGKRGMVRAKPPLPAISGLFGRPTVVNNVLTFAAATDVLSSGPEAYAALGMERSRGTIALQLAGNVRQGGLVELEFGCTLREVVEEFGGGTRSGRPIRAIQVGGPLGAYLPRTLWDTPVDYESFAAVSAVLGHGGIVIFDDTVDMARQARFAMEFCAVESCGKCTPCRVGSVRGTEVIDRIIAREDAAANTTLLRDLCDTMEAGSLCAMGGMTPFPVRSALDYFPEDFPAAGNTPLSASLPDTDTASRAGG